MFGYDWPRFHAAVNDLPAALLFVTVLFEIGGWLTKRASLKAAALWTLWAGVVGGWVAVLAGLKAEDVIEHGEAIHELMEQHERQALITMGIFTVVLVWIASLAITAVLASAQARRDTAPAAVISGGDIGFRPEGWNGRARTGTWVVRINGEWVEAQSSLKTVPATR